MTRLFLRSIAITVVSRLLFGIYILFGIAFPVGTSVSSPVSHIRSISQVPLSAVLQNFDWSGQSFSRGHGYGHSSNHDPRGHGGDHGGRDGDRGGDQMPIAPGSTPVTV